MYTPSRQLRFATDTRLFRIPSFKTKTNGQKSVWFQTATVWNNFPLTVSFSFMIAPVLTKLWAQRPSWRYHYDIVRHNWRSCSEFCVEERVLPCFLTFAVSLGWEIANASMHMLKTHSLFTPRLCQVGSTHMLTKNGVFLLINNYIKK